VRVAAGRIETEVEIGRSTAAEAAALMVADVLADGRSGSFADSVSASRETGMPRIKGPWVDMKPHPFPIIGPQPHIQINIWFDGIEGIQIPIRIPLPGYPWW
jgi:hypothetical protein